MAKRDTPALHVAANRWGLALIRFKTKTGAYDLAGASDVPHMARAQVVASVMGHAVCNESRVKDTP